MFFKSCKSITFSHINSTNFNNNFKDNFMREKVNKKAPKAKTLHISALEPNWKWINDSLILSRKKHDAIPNFNQHWSTIININNAVIYVFSPSFRLEAFSSCFLMTSFPSLSVTPLVCNTASNLDYWTVHKNSTSCYQLTSKTFNCKTVNKTFVDTVA